MKKVVTAISVVLSAALWAPAADYYVAINGDDGYAGTSTNLPWRTLQYAASNVTAGSTVHIGPGTYTGPVTVAVSGSPGQFVTFLGEAGAANVKITGSGITPPNDIQGLFHVDSHSYIRLQGVTICCYTGTTSSHFHMGAYVGGTAHHVEVIDCRIHDIVHTKDEEGANGIGVYGTDEDQAVSNIVIRGCEVFNCKLQYSESVTINGNVDGFLVESNHVHHNDNIGIDAIGWESDVAGGNRRARNGIIRGNRVHHISTTYNPTYNDYSAGGIYIDGGADIVIERNEVYLCDLGIEVGCEHAGKTAEDVIVRNNLVYRNHMCGIAFGGYNTSLGSTRNCHFLNNTLYGNDTLSWWSGQFYIQKAQNNIIANNIIYARDDSDNYLFDERMSPPNASNNVFAYNVFYGESGENNIYFRREGTRRNTWSDYASYTGDTNSIWGDPAFTDAVHSNFTLLTNSAAIDAGDPDFTPADGETDFAGENRVSGPDVDAGAHEYQPFEPDADADGMPDWWEARHSAGATNLMPCADDDGDGQCNLYEYITMTEPTNAASVFSIEEAATQAAGAQMVIRWPGASNRLYAVLWMTNPAGPAAAMASNLPAVFPRTVYTDNTHGVELKGYYRVRAEMAN